jgi:hypothetical protein
MKKVHLRNPDGRSYELYTGVEVSGGERVGSVAWQSTSQTGGNPGYVLCVDGAEYDPDSPGEVLDRLREHGYELYPPTALEDIAALCGR